MLWVGRYRLGASTVRGLAPADLFYNEMLNETEKWRIKFEIRTLKRRLNFKIESESSMVESKQSSTRGRVRTMLLWEVIPPGKNSSSHEVELRLDFRGVEFDNIVLTNLSIQRTFNVSG